MNCPSCRQANLHMQTLEQGLQACTCNDCSGIWIRSTDYWTWLDGRGEDDWVPTENDTLPEVQDTKTAKLCPDCGHITIRYRVASHIDFMLDHCGNCNGMWFDQNEWDVLKLHGLHAKLNKVFTEPWQQKIQQEEAKQARHARYEKILGQDTYLRIRDVKAWVVQHPHGNVLMEYLNNDFDLE